VDATVSPRPTPKRRPQSTRTAPASTHGAEPRSSPPPRPSPRALGTGCRSPVCGVSVLTRPATPGCWRP